MKWKKKKNEIVLLSPTYFGHMISFENKKTVLIKMCLESLHSIKNHVTSG